MSEVDKQDQHRKEQMERLQLKLQKENQKLQRNNAAKFDDLGKKLEKSMDNLDPSLKEQAEALGEISSSAKKNERGQKDLLRSTNRSIRVIEALKEVNDGDNKQFDEMLEIAKEQRSLLRKNVYLVDSTAGAIESLKDTVKNTMGDAFGLVMGVLTESPLLAMGAKGLGEAFNKGSEFFANRKENKEADIEAVIEALESSAMAQEPEVEEQAFSPMSEDDMRQEFFEGLKEGMEQALSEAGLGDIDLGDLDEQKAQEIMAKLHMSYLNDAIADMNEINSRPVVVDNGDESNDVNVAEDRSQDITNAVEDASASEREVLDKQSDWLEDIMKDTRWQRRFAVLGNKEIRSGLTWVGSKIADRYDLFDKAFNKATELKNKVDADNEETKQQLLRKIAEFAEVEDFEPVDQNETLIQAIDDLGYLTIESNDLLQSIHRLMQDEADRNAKIDQGSEEERREANERHRDMLEVMKKNGNGDLEPFDEDAFDTEDFLGDFAGSLLGDLVPAMLRLIPIIAMAGLLGKAFYDSWDDAIASFKESGSIGKAFMTLLASVGDSLMDMAVSAGEFFGLDMEAFKKENRDKYGTMIVDAITEWFDNLVSGIHELLADILPDKVQEMLGVGEYRRTGPTGDEVLENMNVTQDIGQGQIAVDIGKVGRSLDAQQLQDIIDDEEINGVDLTPKMIETLEEMKSLKEQLANPDIAQEDKKALGEQLQSLYNNGKMFTDVPKSFMDSVFSVFDKGVEKGGTLAEKAIANAPTMMPVAGVGMVALPVQVDIPQVDPALTQRKDNMKTQMQITKENLDKRRDIERAEREATKNAGVNAQINAPQTVNNNSSVIMPTSPADKDFTMNKIDQLNEVP